MTCPKPGSMRTHTDRHANKITHSNIQTGDDLVGFERSPVFSRDDGATARVLDVGDVRVEHDTRVAGRHAVPDHGVNEMSEAPRVLVNHELVVGPPPYACACTRASTHARTHARTHHARTSAGGHRTSEESAVRHHHRHRHRHRHRDTDTDIETQTQNALSHTGCVTYWRGLVRLGFGRQPVHRSSLRHS